MIPVKEARDIVLGQIPVLGTERVDLFSALGRVLAEDVVAPHDVPPQTNSAMDGYAVRSEDLQGASKENPVSLDVIADLPAGYVSQQPVGTGQAVRIMTGAPVPDGADTIVRVEDTYTREPTPGPSREGKAAGVFMTVELPPQYDIRLAGEDIHKGETILTQDRLIRPAEIGLLASLGRSSIQVYQRAQVAILSTGDELINIDDPLEPGKIRNANSYSLAAMVLEAGAVPIQLGIAGDTREDLERKFSQAARADLIISSGGVSVGDYDLVKEMLNRAGSEMQFWKVCMKPGKPQAFGKIDGKPTFGLPGNPVSSMVSFEMFVRPALLKMMGHRKMYRTMLNATLEEDFHKRDTRKEFIRVQVRTDNGTYRASITGAQGSGILSSMSKANGLAVIDEERMHVKAGEEAPVMLLDHSLEMRETRDF